MSLNSDYFPKLEALYEVVSAGATVFCLRSGVILPQVSRNVFLAVCKGLKHRKELYSFDAQCSTECIVRMVYMEYHL
jgi:hypothetical protein